MQPLPLPPTEHLRLLLRPLGQARTSRTRSQPFLARLLPLRPPCWVRKVFHWLRRLLLQGRAQRLAHCRLETLLPCFQALRAKPTPRAPQLVPQTLAPGPALRQLNAKTMLSRACCSTLRKPRGDCRLKRRLERRPRPPLQTPQPPRLRRPTSIPLPCTTRLPFSLEPVPTQCSPRHILRLPVQELPRTWLLNAKRRGRPIQSPSSSKDLWAPARCLRTRT